ncbi:hypothetical protein [Dermacoccus nishinomiyaensis]|uniref:hypothetical protein n=1 Tax=Dermacoccus nishinomiyaensis TaxID=1274 RepID=UPI001EF556C1|nr:hypothetical protein [Dermacoccus nishinomiyaensis]MCG7429833.1 hypothetical protein [Dermacoccus nishinomiyaensis]
MFSLKQVLDLAEAEGRVKYAEGFRAGLAAADEANARRHEEDAAAAVERELHERAVYVTAGLSGNTDPSWRGLNPVTATSDELTKSAQDRRAAGVTRFRSTLTHEGAAA